MIPALFIKHRFRRFFILVIAWQAEKTRKDMWFVVIGKGNQDIVQNA